MVRYYIAPVIGEGKAGSNTEFIDRFRASFAGLQGLRFAVDIKTDEVNGYPIFRSCVAVVRGPASAHAIIGQLRGVKSIVTTPRLLDDNYSGAMAKLKAARFHDLSSRERSDLISFHPQLATPHEKYFGSSLMLRSWREDVSIEEFLDGLLGQQHRNAFVKSLFKEDEL